MQSLAGLTLNYSSLLFVEALNQDFAPRSWLAHYSTGFL